MTYDKPVVLAEVVKVKIRKREIRRPHIEWTIYRGIEMPTRTDRGERRRKKVAHFGKLEMWVIYFARKTEYFVISAHYKLRPAKRKRLDK